MYVYSFPNEATTPADGTFDPTGATEWSGKMMEVLPIGFSKFWVWSASKMRHLVIEEPPAISPDPTHDCGYDLTGELNCGITLIKIFGVFPDSISVEASDDLIT